MKKKESLEREGGRKHIPGCLSEEIPHGTYSRIPQDVDRVVRPRIILNASYTPELLMGKAIESGLG